MAPLLPCLPLPANGRAPSVNPWIRRLFPRGGKRAEA